MQQPGLLTVDEVADRLRIATRTVWRWVASGSLPAPLRLGKRVLRWRREDIERFVDGAQARSGEEAGAACGTPGPG